MKLLLAAVFVLQPFVYGSIPVDTIGTGQPPSQATCEYPWVADHNPSARFTVGAFYRHPYTDVWEVLGEIDGRLYVRSVQGAHVGCQNLGIRAVPPLPRLVYVKDGLFYAADCTIAATTLIRMFAKLPEGCYHRSTVITVHHEAVTVRK